MSRRVITKAHETIGSEKVDSFAARVIKYIPADIIAGWVAISGIVVSQTTASPQPGTPPSVPTPDYDVLWGLFVVFLILTALWTWKTTREPNAPTAKTQIIVSTISFVVWVFGIGVPFNSLTVVKNRPYLGGVVMIVWTLVAGLIVPPKSEAVPPGGGNV